MELEPCMGSSARLGARGLRHLRQAGAAQLDQDWGPHTKRRQTKEKVRVDEGELLTGSTVCLSLVEKGAPMSLYLMQESGRVLEGTGLVLAAYEAWRPREVQHRTGIIGT